MDGWFERVFKGLGGFIPQIDQLEKQFKEVEKNVAIFSHDLDNIREEVRKTGEKYFSLAREVSEIKGKLG